MRRYVLDPQVAPAWKNRAARYRSNATYMYNDGSHV